jgi:hypothetical protein
MHEVQRVLQILQSEGECGIPASSHQTRIHPHSDSVASSSTASPHSPLLDEMVQPRDGLRILEVLGERPLSPAQRPRELLRKRLVLPELDEQRLVQEVLHVLVVVKRGGRGRALVGTFLVQRFAGVDAYGANVSISLG